MGAALDFQQYAVAYSRGNYCSVGFEVDKRVQGAGYHHKWDIASIGELAGESGGGARNLNRCFYSFVAKSGMIGGKGGCNAPQGITHQGDARGINFTGEGLDLAR